MQGRAVTRTTRAAVLHEFGSPLVIEELALDPPRAGEIQVRIAATGVCHSDLDTVKGLDPSPLPLVLGHEGAGVVEDVGDGVVGLRPGDHVVLSWLPYCGRCRRCIAGRPNICEDLGWFDAGTMRDGTTRFHLDGRSVYHHAPASFAERSIVPAETAIRLDRSMPLEEAAMIGCAVMTGVGAVLNTAKVRPAESAVVIGCGGVGLNVLQGLRIAAASPVIAVDVVDEKLALARQLGATDTWNASEGDVATHVREILPDGADHVFEALGGPTTIEVAFGLVASGGNAVVVGLAPEGTTVPIEAYALTSGDRSLLGSWYGACVPPRDFPTLLRLYRSGRLELEPLIGATCALDDINEGLARIERREVGRTVIRYEH
jgi:S-(hydroxymethyl)glutathione dehydrogenase/alcohol dehydrogenase